MKRLAILAFAILACLFGAPTAKSATPVKNIVLVHGAFADGSSYAKVIPLLQAKGSGVVQLHRISLTPKSDGTIEELWQTKTGGATPWKTL